MSYEQLSDIPVVRASGATELGPMSAIPRTSIGIGINCLDVNPSFVGGVTTYVLGLLQGFAALKTLCRFRVFATGENQHLFDDFQHHDNFDLVVLHDRLRRSRHHFSRATLLSFNHNIYNFMHGTIYKNVRDLIDSQSDVVYTPTPVLGYYNSRKPTVLSMHDIQHLHHPEFFSWSRRLSRRITYDLSAKRASYLQASSYYIKADLLRHFPWLSSERIVVIPSGVVIEKFQMEHKEASLTERYSLPKRFLFFPAQLWPHKNHITVLKALKRIENMHGIRIPLVLTGEKFSAAAEISTFITKHSMNYVQHLGKVPIPDMVGLYKKAAFMITATLHESSSLPILEAAAAGTPVIASNIPPIQELGQVLQLNLFDPLNTEELAAMIHSLWHDDRTASAQVAHNRAHITTYSWVNTAAKYMQLFERIITS